MATGSYDEFDPPGNIYRIIYVHCALKSRIMD